MKVLCLIQGRHLPSSRVRVLNLLKPLEKRGICCVLDDYPDSFERKLRLLFKLRSFDVVLFQKKIPSFLDQILYRSLARKIVYDFDDAVYCRHGSVSLNQKSTRFSRFSSFLKRCDGVIAGNSYLAEFASKYSDKVRVVPSSVEIDGIPKNPHAKKEEKTVVGWVGGEINLPFILPLKPVLQKLSEEFPLEVKILCSKGIDIPGVDVKFIPWHLDTQEREIASFDIGIMPLPDDVHSRGKCGYKALQYMAAQVPPVVSDVGVNREIVQDGRAGLVARSNDEFYLHLKYLIENPEDRRRMGERAAARVRSDYSIEVAAELLARYLREVGGNP